uniref:Ribosomal RNA-processing protein 4 n=1 Tax=Romanomermis culicivorax TaxID=13658 RepID=A0A915IXD4_ROMCU
MSIEIYLAHEAKNASKVKVPKGNLQHLVTPGQTVTDNTGFMRGHGTYADNGILVASVAGVVHRVNKLLRVNPVKSRYNGEVGDVVIGRITEVQYKRWKVDTNARLDSVLLISSVNLPGGELRRKSEEDELMMRQYLQDGDLISAEVQTVFQDGSLSLHTRSLKYGKLSQGTFVKVPPSLVKRCKNHFHNLPCQASVILGCNGYIWIAPYLNDDETNTGGFVQNLNPVPKEDREIVVRLRNCILLLAQYCIMIFDTTILYAYDASLSYEVSR